MSRDLAGSRRQNPLLLSGHGGRLGNGPAWAPGWLHKDDASSKMREFRLELPDRERVPPVSLQHKKTREPLAAWQTGWRHLGGRESPRGSQHFFGSLAPLRSSMSLEQNEATRALMHFLPPRDTVVQKRHRVRSVLDDAVGTSMPLFAEDTEPPPTKAHQVKDAMLGAAEVPHWNERLGARPNPRVSATDKGLIWGHAHVLVDDQGKLHVQPRGKHHGCSAREIDLKHTLLDSVRGSLFVVLEEIQKEVPRLDTSSANQSRLEQVYLLQESGIPKLELKAEEKKRVPPSPLFLRFESDIEKFSWIDVLVQQGAEPGLGVKHITRQLESNTLQQRLRHMQLSAMHDLKQGQRALEHTAAAERACTNGHQLPVVSISDGAGRSGGEAWRRTGTQASKLTLPSSGSPKPDKNAQDDQHQAIRARDPRRSSNPHFDLPAKTSLYRQAAPAWPAGDGVRVRYVELPRATLTPTPASCYSGGVGIGAVLSMMRPPEVYSSSAAQDGTQGRHSSLQ